jgi:lysophospholipase L1-like esterase
MFNHLFIYGFMKTLKCILLISLTLCSIEMSFSQDWPNLERFQKANRALSTPAPGEHRIVFMGNSITEFWSVINPAFFKNSTYVNRGISGQTTPQMLLRFRQDVIQLEPVVVVILAGINDIAENTGPITIETIAGNIISMAELAKANAIKVVLCSVLPASEFSWNPAIQPAEKVIKLNGILKSYAAKNALVYVDYFSAMVNESKGLKKALGDDGVHPNKAGYLLMEPILQRGIATALSQQ